MYPPANVLMDDALIVNSSSADSDVEAKKVCNYNEIDRRYSFSKASWSRRTTCNDRAIVFIMGHYRVALLLLDRIHLSAQKYLH